jgi:hypothetical protein
MSIYEFTSYRALGFAPEELRDSCYSGNDRAAWCLRHLERREVFAQPSTCSRLRA